MNLKKHSVHGVKLDATDDPKKEVHLKLGGKPHIVREDGRIEWICKHGIGHTVAVPAETLKAFGKDRRRAFTHGCCVQQCCLEKLDNII